MGLLGNIFGGISGNNKAKELLEQGAVIIDVRTPGEFAGGHVAGSRNIPLNTIGNRVNEIKKMKKPVVLCCASGARSGQATNMLQRQGVECANGGGWTRVNGMLNS